MNRLRHRILLVSAGIMLAGPSARAEDPPAEPLELTRLRQQFQHRVEQEMIPWREKYRKELQKLEDRLIGERKLVEALAVKKEREASAPLSSEPEAAAAPSKVPGSVKEAREFLAGTVWLVYLADDKKRESPVDTYHFLNGESVYFLTHKRALKWSLRSATQAVIQLSGGEAELEFEFAKQLCSSKYLGAGYVMVLAGRPGPSRK
jgi:hypothetical protein